MNMTIGDTDYSVYCLEKWVIWRYDKNSGYSKESAINRIGKARNVMNRVSLPNGVAINDRDIEIANTVITIMNGMKLHEDIERILKVILNRDLNQKVKEVCKNLKITPTSYYKSLRTFTTIAMTIYYLRNNEYDNPKNM